jgi:transcriptional regulator NrdR family protein
MNHARVSRDQLGIACPTCGCRHFDTTHTEPLRDGRIRRRKVCRHCGRKVLTYESTAAAATACGDRNAFQRDAPATHACR